LVSFSYPKRISLFGNVNLVIDFAASQQQLTTHGDRVPPHARRPLRGDPWTGSVSSSISDTGFRGPRLLSRALTHRSHSALHNERLEFLATPSELRRCGGAVRALRRASEGELSRLRAHLVREESLHQVAQTLRLGDTLQLGKAS